MNKNRIFDLIVYIGLLLFLFLIGNGKIEIIFAGIKFYFGENLQLIILFLLLPWLLYLLIKKQLSTVFKNSSFFYLLLFLCCITLSSILAPFPISNLATVFSVLLGIFLSIMMMIQINTWFRIKTALSVFVFGQFIHIAAVYKELFQNKDFINQTNASFLSATNLSISFISIAIAVTIPLILLLIRISSRRIKIFYTVVLIIYILLIIPLSVNSLLAFCLLVPLIFIIFSRKNRKKSAETMLIVLLTMSLLLLILHSFFIPIEYNNYNNKGNSLTNFSLQNNVTLSFAILKDYPLTGIGSSLKSNNFLCPIYKKSLNISEISCENLYFYWLNTFGLLGIIAIIVMIVFINKSFISVLRVASSFSNEVLIFSLAGMTNYLISGVYFNQMNFSATFFMFWVLIGLNLIAMKQNKFLHSSLNGNA